MLLAIGWAVLVPRSCCHEHRGRVPSSVNVHLVREFYPLGGTDEVTTSGRCRAQLS